METLLKLLHKQPHKGNNNDYRAWNLIEKIHHIKIPSDYKEIINKFGTIYINNFIWILSPFNTNPAINFSMAESLIGAYKSIQKEFPDIYPQLGEREFAYFFPWAITDNGDSICWIWDSTQSLKIGIFDKSQAEKEIYNMDTSSFLTSYLTNKINSKILNNTSDIEGEDYIDLNAFLREGRNLDDFF